MDKEQLEKIAELSGIKDRRHKTDWAMIILYIVVVSGGIYLLAKAFENFPGLTGLTFIVR